MRSPRYDPRASARRSVLATTAIGLAVLAGLFAFILVGLRAPDAIPGRSYYKVSVALSDANTLAGHSDVRIGGARVGQTLNPRFRGGRAVIDLQLDARVRPILTDASVRVRPKSAIGQPYVDLSPGKSGRPIPDGGRIPARQTQTSVPLDQVLGTFDAPTRVKFQTMMNELGASVAGRGEGGGQSVRLGPAMLADTAAVTDRLAAEPAAIRGFVRGSADLADAFAGVKTPLADMFKPAAQVMSTIADTRPQLEATLAEAPPTFAAVTDGLADVHPAVVQLGAFARAALPPLRLAPGALRETSAMLRAAPGVVPQVDRTLELADDAVAPTLTLLRSARHAAPWLDGFMKAADPTVDELAPRRCDIVRLARNWQNMFAFGEPKQMGGTGLDLDIDTPDLSAIGGLSDVLKAGNVPNVPVPRNPYPGPCEAYTNAARLGKNGAR